MKTKKADHRIYNGREKGEPSVRIVALTALDTPQLHDMLCRWWEERKELWNDQYKGLDRRDPI